MIASRGRLVGTRRRLGPVPAWWRAVSVAAFSAVLLFVTALWASGGNLQGLDTATGVFMSVGRLSGLLASALLLAQVFLMARVPWVEQAFGQDALVRIHRVVGFTSITLVLVHVVTIVLGYADLAGIWSTLVGMVLTFDGMLLAVAGLLALLLVVLTSLRAARRRLRYESWHLLHLYAYLGAGLALPHQLWTGQDFRATPVATVFWWSLYAVCLGAVLVWRLALPAWRSLRHPLRVTSVHTGPPGVTTVTVQGDGLRHLPVRAGQFFLWRFLDGPGWSRANPYSLSAAPVGDTLRFTAVHAGDGSRRLERLRPGTRVLLEGPYGRLHEGVRSRPKVLLMGSGAGITPLHALLQDMAQRPGDLTVLHRVRDWAGAALGSETESLARQRGARYVVIPGRRDPTRRTWLPHDARHWDDASALLDILPDLADHDVYLCGAPGWAQAASTALLRAGLPTQQLHVEHFGY